MYIAIYKINRRKNTKANLNDKKVKNSNSHIKGKIDNKSNNCNKPSNNINKNFKNNSDNKYNIKNNKKTKLINKSKNSKNKDTIKNNNNINKDKDISKGSDKNHKVNLKGIQSDNKKISVIGGVRKRVEEIKANKRLMREKAKLLSDWVKVMAHSKIYNSLYDTFTILDEKRTSYGWSFKLKAPYGLSYDMLDKLQPIIESNMECLFMYNIDESKRYADCKLVYPNEVKCNNIPYEPVKVKPYEFCPGVDVTGKPIIIDLNESPHVLIAGQTRRGKNGANDHAILNWCNSCSENEVQFYLLQCAKNDLIKYKNLKHTQCFILGDFEKMCNALKYLVDVEMERRNKLFQNMFETRKGENINDYNKLYPDKALPYIYVIVDEFAELKNQQKHEKELNSLKDNILSYLQKIGQLGAAVGVQYIILHQKPSKEYCPTFIKNMSSVRVCFGFEDESCGRVVLGDAYGHLAKNLHPRRAYINNNGSLELMYTTNLTGKRDLYISKHEVKNKKYIIDKVGGNSKINISRKEVRSIENTNGGGSSIVRKEAGTAPLPKGNATKKVSLNNANESKNEYNKYNSQVEGNKENLRDTVEYASKSNNRDKDKGELNNRSLTSKSSSNYGVLCSDENNEDNKYKNLDKVSKNTIEFSSNNKIDNIKNVSLEDTYKVKNDNAGGIKIIKITDEDLQRAAQEIISENVKKIPNFVPYEPKPDEKITDPMILEKAKRKLLKDGFWE